MRKMLISLFTFLWMAGFLSVYFMFFSDAHGRKASFRSCKDEKKERE